MAPNFINLIKKFYKFNKKRIRIKKLPHILKFLKYIDFNYNLHHKLNLDFF